MREGPIIIPNELLFREVEAAISRGESVTIPFNGRSMEPLLLQGRNTITLSPLSRDVRVGDVVLFRYRGTWILHRIDRIEGQNVTLQGDNCYSKEKVTKSDIVALLTGVNYKDGRTIETGSDHWISMSRKAVRHNKRRNAVLRFIDPKVRRIAHPIYFLLLLLLMWAPMGFMGLPLNSFVFHLRVDHLLHALLFVPCSWMLIDCLPMKKQWLWLPSVGICVIIELGQLLLPYRGFDITDMVANIVGVVFGWSIFMVARKLMRSRR